MGNTANASRIALPRGKVYFARKTAAGVQSVGMRFLGNASKLEFATIGDDIAEVVDFTANTPTPLTRISKKRVPEFPISLMECDPDNLALVFMGSVTDYTQAATAVTVESLGLIHVGGIYKTAKLLGSTGTIQGVDSGMHELALTTNYVVRDQAIGLIEVVALPSGTVDGDVLTIDYTPYAISTALKKISGGDVSRIEGALLYVGTSTVGPRHQLQIWNCSIESDGAFPFIAEEPVNFGLKVTVLTDPLHTDLFQLLELATGA